VAHGRRKARRRSTKIKINGRVAARGFSPAAAARHSKFGIPVRAFVLFHAFWVVHRLFYFQVITLVTIVRLFTPKNIIIRIDVGSTHQ